MQSDSPLSKRKRITLTAMTGALSDICEDDGAEPCAKELVTHSTEVTMGTTAPMATECAVEALPPPPQRRVFRRAGRRNGSDVSVRNLMAPMTPPQTVREGSPDVVDSTSRRPSLKRCRDERDSIGATARVEAMVVTASLTLADSGNAEDSDGSSTNEEKSFAYRVRHAHSFASGVKAAEAALVSGEVVSPGMPENVSALVLMSGSPKGAFSRKAFKSGLRAAEVAAKVEAELAATRSSSVKSPGPMWCHGKLEPSPLGLGTSGLPVEHADGPLAPNLHKARKVAAKLFNK